MGYAIFVFMFISGVLNFYIGKLAYDLYQEGIINTTNRVSFKILAYALRKRNLSSIEKEKILKCKNAYIASLISFYITIFLFICELIT